MTLKRMTPTHTVSLAPIVRTGKHDGEYSELLDFARAKADRAGHGYPGRHAAGLASDTCNLSA